MQKDKQKEKEDEQKMKINDYKKKIGSWINPAEEDLWAKFIDLKDKLYILQKQGLTAIQEDILQRCKEKLEEARASISQPWHSFYKKNHKIFWSLVHRVDEDIILLIPKNELLGKVTDVRTSFDMNITEEKMRDEWLGREGEKGKLTDAIERLEGKKKKERNKGHEVEELKELSKEDIDYIRHVVKDALRIINDQADRTFWILSMNTMVSVLSGIFLLILMYIFYRLCYTNILESLANSKVKDTVIPIALLGLMGAFVSNLVTRKNFLFIIGPFWRYLLHHILSKPVLGAFAAVFIFILEKSKIIFSLNPVSEGSVTETATQQIITINVGESAIGYVYAILAVASGFAADKILREMIDKVLRRLEEKAEKTKETKEESK